MKNILVAIDFDERESRLIDYAEKMAGDYNAKVWLVHCAQPDSDFVSIEAASNYERNDLAQKLRAEHQKLQQMADGLESKGTDVEALFIQGPTVATLLEKAADVKADLIIAGMHEHGFLYNAFIGNTAIELLKRSQIPILTIPSP